MSWSWKTKPRSIIRTVQWFPCFASLKGQDWNRKSSAVSRRDGKPVHPVRRSYIYAAHGDEDSWLSEISYRDYLSGRLDQKETEANGRMDKGAFEFFGFGYVKTNGEVAVTEVGSRIVQGIFDDEDYLKQLLKLRLPNCTYEPAKMKLGRFVFPFQLVLEAFREFESLNRSELALLFGCDDMRETGRAMSAIRQFKEEYGRLENKNDTARVKELFARVYQAHYGKMQNQADSYYEYAEALSRALVYTGLFSGSGRSIATKLRVAGHSAMKVRLLQEKYEFFWPQGLSSLDDYMGWFGASGSVTLPWENVGERRAIISAKAAILLEQEQKRKAEAGQEEPRKAEQPEGEKRRKAEQEKQRREELEQKERRGASVVPGGQGEELARPGIEEGQAARPAALTGEQIRAIVENAAAARDVGELKEYEAILSSAIVSQNEEYFIRVLSKTSQERQAILDRFDSILANDDMSALWLEVNTWKSLIAIDGSQRVKRNFRIEDDLTPKSFAPGVGNTPDMELYGDGFVIVPEVSLMTGVRQWEHEGSSVIDHVLEFIRECGDSRVLGLFLSSRIHHRTMWQFFVLNRESWMGVPVPVIPLTIAQYMGVAAHLYEKGRRIEDLRDLLEMIADSAGKCASYQEWEKAIGSCIKTWMEKGARGGPPALPACGGRTEAFPAPEGRDASRGQTLAAGVKPAEGSGRISEQTSGRTAGQTSERTAGQTQTGISAVRAREQRLSPLLKYPGGKEKELKYIVPNLPPRCMDYYEPFVGGGAVYFALEARHCFINDKSPELAGLYRMVQEQNPRFLEAAADMERCWRELDGVTEGCRDSLIKIYMSCRKKGGKMLERRVKQFIAGQGDGFEAVIREKFPQGVRAFLPQLGKSLRDKMERMARLERQKGKLSGEDLVLNLEGAVKNAAYIHFRYLYNHIEELGIDQPFATALYFFMREYCYSSMFRYNQEGKFNVPYGGISYNKKSMAKKIQYFSEPELGAHLGGTVVENLDFEEFFRRHEPREEDFVFLDPPYDSEFSTYAGNEFGRADQERLADFLIHKCQAYFMLVIKNTDFIRSLYPAGCETAGGRRLYVGMFDKKYVVSFQDRNDKSAQHLIITNYPLPHET